MTRHNPAGWVEPISCMIRAAPSLRDALRAAWSRVTHADARLFQIAFLGTLLAAGVLLRDFNLRPQQMALAFCAGLVTQALFLRALRIRHAGLLSATITCFGLSILLRADSLWVHPLAASLAIASKFVLRVNGKHVCNPANLGVVASLLLLPGTWISPGQWGSDLAYAGWFVVLGALVTRQARRWDVSWMFLACNLGLIALRVAWLGQTWSVFTHQLQSGALLLFAFFMISDPMTIPNRRSMRMLYALVVAIAAFCWQFALFRPNALVWALFLCTPLVPVLDRLVPGAKFSWSALLPSRAKT